MLSLACLCLRAASMPLELLLSRTSLVRTVFILQSTYYKLCSSFVLHEDMLTCRSCAGCTAPLGLAGQHAGRNSTLSELHARARGLLQELVPLAVVRETAGSGQTWAERRYIMHPLVQEVAAGMLKDLGESEYAGAYSAFASYMLDLMEDLVRVKFISSDSLLTQQLMSDEFKNIRNLARVLLELIEEREPQHVQKCNCPVVAAAMRQRGNIKQALIVEQAIAWVQNDRDGAQ